MDDLKVADVFFCYGDKSNWIWRLISYGSSGQYVHAAIYLGNNEVAEAGKKGVVFVPLAEFLERYKYVAVARCPGVGTIPNLQEKVVEYCTERKGRTAYSYLGALLSPMYEFLELFFDRFLGRALTIKWPQSRKRTFCSQLVIDAFIAGGYIEESFLASGARSPTALAEDNTFRLTGYFTTESNIDSLLEKDVFWTGGG